MLKIEDSIKLFYCNNILPMELDYVELINADLYFNALKFPYKQFVSTPKWSLTFLKRTVLELIIIFLTKFNFVKFATKIFKEY